MKAIIQRVQEARVIVEDKEISSISTGLLTLLGVATGDTEQQMEKLVSKILQLRIFEDDSGKLNRSVIDIRGQHLIVSQFTLLGNCRKGTRPSFGSAERPDRAKELYEKAIGFSGHKIPTFGGQFQADMKIHLINDGPVTIIHET